MSDGSETDLLKPNVPPSRVWRVGRLVGLCMAIVGIGTATAGRVAELPPLSIAGGDLFGGVVTVLAGLVNTSLILTILRSDIGHSRTWLFAGTAMLACGLLLLFSAYDTISTHKKQRQEIRDNLRAISDAMEGS